MKQLIPFARKRRQWLRAWASAHRAVGAERARFLRRLRRLAHTFRAGFTVPQWARVTAALAALVLAPNAAEAQAFAAPTNAAFGLNTFATDRLLYPSFVDLDNDGDLDLVASHLYDAVGAYLVPNTGTAAAPVFGVPQPAPFGLTDTLMFYTGFSDLDNDGDLDILAYKYDDYGSTSGFYYYQNTGSAAAPSFGTPAFNPFGLNGTLPISEFAVGRFVDLDNDGDDDYLAMSFNNSGFRYYQNTGTASSPQFAAPVINPFGLNTSGLGNLAFVEVGDLDLDGDFDIIASEYDYGNWTVYTNNGTALTPSFAAPSTNPFGLSAGGFLSMFDLADLDADGDLDLFLFNESEEAKFYQNNDPNASVEEVASLVGLAPNPAKDRFSLDFGSSGDWSVVLVNASGQEVYRTAVQDASCLEVSVGDLPAGVYTVRAQTLSGTQTGAVVIQP